MVYEKTDVDDYMSDAWKYIRFLLGACGMWPLWPKTNWTVFLQLCWIFQHGSIMLVEIINFIIVGNNIDSAIECMPPLLYNTLCAVKFINNYFNMKKMKGMLEHMQKDWQESYNQPYSEVLIQYTDLGKRIGLYCMCLVFAAIVCTYMSTPLIPPILNLIKPLNISRPRKFVYETEYFVNQENHYYPILMHAYVSSIAGGLLFSGVDILYLSFVLHACGMFSMLGKRLESCVTRDQSNPDIKSLTSNDEVTHKEVITLVMQHRRVIEFSNCIADTYNIAFLILLAMNSVALSITGVATILKWGQPDMIKFSTFTAAQIFHLFYISMPGQLIIDHSLQIQAYIYNSLWYTKSPDTRKLLIPIMMRSNKPCLITGGKFFHMSIDNFASVVKTSMSFFTLLKSTR